MWLSMFNGRPKQISFLLRTRMVCDGGKLREMMWSQKGTAKLGVVTKSILV